MTRSRKPTVYGVAIDAVQEWVGSTAQFARIDSFVDSNGPAAGSRRMRLVTGGGLEVEVLPDRALDIGHLTFDGIPLGWISAVGQSSPHEYDPEGTEWLRTFGGGFLATCGLDTFGPPSSDGSNNFPMHGRIGAIPSTVTEVSVSKADLVIAGEVRQSKVFSDNYLLQRTISAELGGSSLRISDTVTNLSFSTVGHMVLYHFNLGWPLVGPDSILTIPSDRTNARDADAESGKSRWSEIGQPSLGFKEQVFEHQFSEERVAVSVYNPKLGIRCSILFNTSQLPALYQWKMQDYGHYVLGLEPANVAHVHGRQSAQEAGVLPLLEPQQSVTYDIEIQVERSSL